MSSNEDTPIQRVGPTKMCFWAFTGLAGTLLAFPATAHATPGGPGAVPPSAVIGAHGPSHPVTDSASVVAARTQKQDTAAVHAADVARNARTRVTTDVTPMATTANDMTTVVYQSQVNEVYCGPATTAMIAHAIRVGWSGTANQQQQSAANLLRTTNHGTAWYGSDNVPTYPGTSWYPVEDVLNYRLYQHNRSNWYIATAVNGTPTSQQNTYYKNAIVYDVDKKYAMALNQYSVPGYQFYYQPNGSWQHWLVGRGYAGSGASTIVSDPGWTAGKHATVLSTSGAGSVTYAIGARGYIW
jgi:hypothetical protein